MEAVADTKSVAGLITRAGPTVMQGKAPAKGMVQSCYVMAEGSVQPVASCFVPLKMPKMDRMQGQMVASTL